VRRVEWTWYVHVVAGSGQTGRTGGKCLLWYDLLSVRFTICYSGDQI